MSEAEKKVLLERRKEIADSKVIGGSEIAEENGVNVKKEILNFCYCDRIVEDKELLLCHVCREKLCKSCAYTFTNKKKICYACLQKEIPLTKREYKVLLMIRSRIDKKGDIRRITNIPKSEVKPTFDSLIEKGYVVTKWHFWREISDLGMEIITVYGQIYDEEEDVAHLLDFRYL